MRSYIAYRGGYKYQLCQFEIACTDILPPHKIETDYLTLDEAGVLTIEAGYAWDGPSGPTIDRAANMRGSLYHDAGYQLMRLELLDAAIYRAQFDDLLYRTWVEDGMPRWLAAIEVKLVKLFAAEAAMRKSEPPVRYAPE